MYKFNNEILDQIERFKGKIAFNILRFKQQEVENCAIIQQTNYQIL